MIIIKTVGDWVDGWELGKRKEKSGELRESGEFICDS